MFHDDSFDDFWDFYFDFGPVFLSEPAKIIIRLWYRKTTDNPSHQYSQIFLKDEIVQAFKEFDLDQNQNIDRWELNHILINIGEQVTNQEISAMIIMADMDGDGRISWDEFHSLINGFPSSQNLITGQYLVNVRNEKRQILSDFADENKLNLKSIKNSFEQYQLDESGLVDYTELCTALQIPPSKSCETIFGAFASQKTGHIDFHEFLISLSNCSGAGQDEIITFSFSIYDPHDNGGITEKQLTKIVKANYMATYNVEVERYVREAMFRVHKHGCEIISLDEIKRQLKKRHHSLV